MKEFRLSRSALILLLILLASCGKKTERFYKEYKFNFNEGALGWEVLFSDYPIGEELNYELSFEHTGLPAPLDNSIKSLKVSGNNHSDDLLSIIYKKITGLAPNTKYKATFDIDLASNACKSCPGSGGTPDLTLGAGGLSIAPASHTETIGAFTYYRPNFTTRIQSELSNDTMMALGTIGVEGGVSPSYSIINRNNNSAAITISTNAAGEMWMMVGVDSGFEGTTTLYYKEIKITLIK